MEHVIRLLVVDDEREFLDAIARRLRKRGFEVMTASNGPDAIELARLEKFDLAILDLKMPGMHGSEVLRRLRAEHQFLETIILTGHGSAESTVALTKLGAYSYLPKPYELDQLIRTLKDAYQRRLNKKFIADEQMKVEILAATVGESPHAMLRRLRDLDYDEVR